MIPTPVTVLYEDIETLAVEKRSGVVVIPARRGETEVPLVRQVEEYVGKKIYVVHRLDRETSGIVLFAKNPVAHRHLCLQFQQRKVGKIYAAVVQGVLAEDGTISSPLREFGSGRVGVDENGKPSQTRYRILESLPSATWLEVIPATGRRHQIRAHLYSIGHAVLGDNIYGLQRPVGGVPRLMLHAGGLKFQTRGSTEVMVRSDPPEDFMRILEILRTKVSG